MVFILNTIEKIIFIISIILGICFYIFACNSVEYKYIGNYDNNTIWNNAYKACDKNKFLYQSGCCNKIVVYCQKYKFPLSIITVSGAYDNYNIYIWFWSD